ncbi:TetR/AcrR family transcriptional regulator [Lentisalinibacter orientalis]|uniref:TetR/AcrR family transcriptional regulator n=1 Tax=Lentisalinibacter orientalis TaxID=2992241 RepID=UPI003863CD75
MQEDTREQLLESAMKLFAARGFYGASLANIADELGLTKQALLHHFGRKEKLYAEILSGISDRMLGLVEAARVEHTEPSDQLLAALLSVYEYSVATPHETRIIIRELLDSERRAEEVSSWYLRPFLDSLVDMTRSIPGRQSLNRTDALTQIYPILGAMSYLIVSDVVLPQMYGKANYSRMQRRYPDEIRKQVRELAEQPD